MSWSEDDDLDLLLDALLLFEETPSSAHARGVHITITGDGPRRKSFMIRIGNLRLRKSSVAAEWIPADDYPSVLAGADAGLSLHRSTSGLDLPMKWVDLIQAGVPLVALDYGSVVHERLDGISAHRLFRNAPELTSIFGKLSQMSRSSLDAWRETAAEDLGSMLLWDTEWKNAMDDLLEGIRTPRS